MPLPFPVEVCCSGEFVALTYPSPTRQQQAAARRVPITFDCYTKEEAWARCNEPIGWESVYPALSPLESEKKVYTTITLSIVLARERSGVNAQLHPQGYLCRGLLTEANQFLQSLQLGPIACTSPTIEPESITARSIRIRFPQSLSQICNIMGLAGNSDQLRIIESLKANEVCKACKDLAAKPEQCLLDRQLLVPVAFSNYLGAFTDEDRAATLRCVLRTYLESLFDFEGPSIPVGLFDEIFHPAEHGPSSLVQVLGRMKTEQLAFTRMNELDKAHIFELMELRKSTDEGLVLLKQRQQQLATEWQVVEARLSDLRRTWQRESTETTVHPKIAALHRRRELQERQTMIDDQKVKLERSQLRRAELKDELKVALVQAASAPPSASAALLPAASAPSNTAFVISRLSATVRQLRQELSEKRKQHTDLLLQMAMIEGGGERVE